MSWRSFEITVLGFTLILLIFKTSLCLRIYEILFFVCMALGLYQKNTNAFCKSKKSLLGKTVIVTGGTSGMGLEIASDLADRGAKVIIACPFKEEGLRAKATIERKTGSEKIIFKLLDLASFISVRHFAAGILETEDRLDILQNNAGIGVFGESVTSDGLHKVMQVNYYGTFLLTILLLPLLKKTGTSTDPSRIVNTSSFLHYLGKIDIGNWNRTNYWNHLRLYGNSKLCLVLFTIELSKKLNDAYVVVHALDPGLVGTAIFRSEIFKGLRMEIFWTFLFEVLSKNPWEGSQTALYVCLSDTVTKSTGKYFRNLEVRQPYTGGGCEEQVTKRVWEHSVEIVKLTQDELI